MKNMMHEIKYYYEPEDRLIGCMEMCSKYGTEFQVYELGIYPLSVQPDYIPIGFHDNGDGTFYPIESYTAMQLKAIKALVEAGMTEEEAMEALK